MGIKERDSSFTDAHLILNESDGRKVAYAVIVLVYGDPVYPFNDIDKLALRNEISETVLEHLLPEQKAELFTMDNVTQ